MRFRVGNDSSSNRSPDHNNKRSNHPPITMSNLFAVNEVPVPASTTHQNNSSMGVMMMNHDNNNDNNINNNDHDNVLQEQCVELFQSQQYRSCELVARMELAQAQKYGRDTDFALSMLGACFQATHQYRRAISFYRRLHNHHNSNNNNNIHHNNYEYRHREAVCLQALGSVVEASSVLEMVPESRRTLAMHMLLGNLYMACGRSQDAASCFMQALTRNPYCWEALEKLALQRVDKHRVLNVLLPQQPQLDMQHPTLQQQQQTAATAGGAFPMADLVHAYFTTHRLQTQPALQQFIQLERDFPNNVHLLLKIAALQVCRENQMFCFSSFSFLSCCKICFLMF